MPSLAEVRANVVAGLIVGVIALPLSIALAVAVGVPPVAGLYTAAFAGFIAAVFGGSNFNITGPTAALVPILSHTVFAHGVRALPLVGVMSGIFLLGMSALRLGRLMRYMPGLVIVGFTAGIAISIASGQLNNFLGVVGTNPGLEHFHQKTWDTLRHLDSVHLTTPLVAIASLGVLIVWPRIPVVQKAPAALIAVIGMTAISWGVGLDTPTLAGRYGQIPSGFPRPSVEWFDAGLIIDLIPVALAIALLGGIESLLSATVADGMASAPIRHDGDRELRGQGLANIIAPVFGAIPSTAAIARTAAGIRNGATSRLTGVVHALTVLAATLVFGGLAGHIPLATLAAVLVIVAWNIAEAPEIARLIRRAPREDLIVLISTVLITVFLDLTYAIGFGILASAFLLLRRLVALPAAEELLADETGRITQVSPELSELIRSRPDIAFFTAQGMLSFHSAAAFEYEIGDRTRNPLILRMKDVHHIDTSGLLTLEGIIEHRQRHGGRMILTAVQPEVLPVLEKFKILAELGPENVFEHTKDAIASIDAPHGHEAHPHPAG
jgi:SulP family sulfate permease